MRAAPEGYDRYLTLLAVCDAQDLPKTHGATRSSHVSLCVQWMQLRDKDRTKQLNAALESLALEKERLDEATERSNVGGYHHLNHPVRCPGLTSLPGSIRTIYQSSQQRSAMR